MSDDNTVFIKIDTPLEFRKALLMSIREMIHSLQRNDTVKQIRVEKAEQVMKLKKITKEIEVLLNRLKADMPIMMESRKKDKAPVKKAVKGKVKGKAIKSPKMSEMQKLEGQLRDIEGKLKDM